MNMLALHGYGSGKYDVGSTIDIENVVGRMFDESDTIYSTPLNISKIYFNGLGYGYFYIEDDDDNDNIILFKPGFASFKKVSGSIGLLTDDYIFIVTDNSFAGSRIETYDLNFNKLWDYYKRSYSIYEHSGQFELYFLDNELYVNYYDSSSSHDWCEFDCTTGHNSFVSEWNIPKLAHTHATQYLDRYSYKKIGSYYYKAYSSKKSVVMEKYNSAGTLIRTKKYSIGYEYADSNVYEFLGDLYLIVHTSCTKSTYVFKLTNSGEVVYESNHYGEIAGFTSYKDKSIFALYQNFRSYDFAFYDTTTGNLVQEVNLLGHSPYSFLKLQDNYQMIVHKEDVGLVRLKKYFKIKG